MHALPCAPAIASASSANVPACSVDSCNERSSNVDDSCGHAARLVRPAPSTSGKWSMNGRYVSACCCSLERGSTDTWSSPGTTGRTAAPEGKAGAAGAVGEAPTGGAALAAAAVWALPLATAIPIAIQVDIAVEIAVAIATAAVIAIAAAGNSCKRCRSAVTCVPSSALARACSSTDGTAVGHARRHACTAAVAIHWQGAPWATAVRPLAHRYSYAQAGNAKALAHGRWRHAMRRMRGRAVRAGSCHVPRVAHPLRAQARLHA
eukprot:359153-Chlamydomonas_euryale.AAC.3